jgi:polysaccharide pyruvyl transferase WcaK-like protein
MKIKYIGWLGQNNLGDEICYNVIKNLLEKKATEYRKEISIESGMNSGMSGDEHALVIGGGTLLRLASDSRTSVMKFAIQHDIPVYFFGTGVIDIPYETVDRITPEVLEILNRSTVCVRGPQSRKNLADNGFFGAKVISDPGLLVSPKYASSKESKIVGINIGSTCHNLFGSEKYVMGATERIIDYLTLRGFEVILFPMWDKDFEIIKQLSRDSKFKAISWDGDIQKFLDTLSGFKFIIGMKLHAIVTAASLGIPYISLAYRNKCVDFSESIGLEKYCIKTDIIGLAEKVIETIGTLENGYDQAKANMSHWKEKYAVYHESLAEKIITGIS